MTEQLPGQMDIFDMIEDPEVQEKNKFDILIHIPVGSNNAVKRKHLCTVTGLIDRTMRDFLHDARKLIPIINLQNGKGYFIPDMNLEEDKRMLARWVRQEESRIKESQLIVDVAKRTLINCGEDWRCMDGRSQVD